MHREREIHIYIERYRERERELSLLLGVPLPDRPAALRLLGEALRRRMDDVHLRERRVPGLSISIITIHIHISNTYY